MNDELFPLSVVWFAGAVVMIMLLWISLIYCGDIMKEMWDAMQGREWRWPEGTNGVYGPGDEPHHRRLKHNTAGKASPQNKDQ